MKTKSLKILRGLKIVFFVILCAQLSLTFVLAGWPTKVSAADDAATSLQFVPQIRIPDSVFNSKSVTVAAFNPETGRMSSDLLAKYIQAIYNYGMAIVGILAAIVLMGGGVLWLTSGGDSSKISQAKELIFGSIIGTGILFGSWIILNTVNPELLKLKSIETISIPTKRYCCDPTKGNNVNATRDSKCSLPATLCEDGQSCSNTGNNTFACINDSEYLCCEYGNMYCRPMQKTTNQTVCASSTLIYTKYYLTNTYNGYCTPHTLWTGGDLANCTTNICANKKDGELCSKVAEGAGYSFAYCYNEICWVGEYGKQGEPCGNEGGKCMGGWGGDNCPTGYDHDYFGRSCETGYSCCKPD
jgi:hypothetical protein